MSKYFIKFSYIGSLYRGAQKSSSKHVLDNDSIQGVIETALLRLKPRNIIQPKLHLCSRTDAGVHALCSAGHIVLQNQYNIAYDPVLILKHLNKHFITCKHTIRAQECIPVTMDFHVRRGVKSRTYIYRFMIAKDNTEYRVPITETLYCYNIRTENFDIERVKQATQLFVGLKDFSTFVSKSRENEKTNYIRELNSFTLEEGRPFMPYDPLTNNYDFWDFKCTAKSFLYNQVRRMVGTLFALGTGKITEKDIMIMLQVPSPHNFLQKINTAPPFALFLTDIQHDKDILDKYRMN